ncbi:small ribosomal subunit protein bS18m-like [Saccoglossus kowalevskii]
MKITNVQLLSQFVSPHTGNVFSQEVTGLCTNRYKEVSNNIKRARKMGFMPVIYKESVYLNDPKIIDERNMNR